MRNIHTQSTNILPQIGNIISPDEATLLANGWRYTPELPEPDNGFERLTPPTLIEGDGRYGEWELHDTLIADRLAAEQAAKMASLTPDLIMSAHVYRVALRRNFGDGAETNQAITARTVKEYFAGKATAGTIITQELADAELLTRTFSQIAAWTGDGTAWSFPWEVVP